MTEQGEPRGVPRRSLLQAAVAVPTLAVAAGAAGTATAAAAGPHAGPTRSGGAGRFDPASPRFAIAVLPDTQYLFDADSADPAPLRATFEYLRDQRPTRTSRS